MRPVAKIVSLIATVATLAMANAASATSITWNTNSTNGSCAVGYTCNSSERSFLGSDGTTVVTAKAWSYNSYTGSIVASNLGFYSPGLGVLSPYDESHTVDNYGYKDFIAFYFSEEVDINAVYLNTYGDTDMTAWIGTVPGVPSFTGQDFNDLDVNYGASFDNTGGNVNRLADFGLDAQNGNLLVVAALDNGSTNDRFKIRTLYAESIASEPDDPPPSNTVASPSSLMVFGPAVFGLAAVRRRRARKAFADATAQPVD